MPEPIYHRFHIDSHNNKAQRYTIPTPTTTDNQPRPNIITFTIIPNNDLADD
jgi:hypothetical protein